MRIALWSCAASFLAATLICFQIDNARAVNDKDCYDPKCDGGLPVMFGACGCTQMETCDFAGSEDSVIYCRYFANQDCTDLTTTNSCTGKCATFGNICTCTWYTCKLPF